MKNFLTASVVVAALAAAPAFAQSTDTTTEDKTPSIDSQLSMGEDASIDPELGKPYTKSVDGAWEQRCIKAQEGEDPCQMYQLLDDGEGVPVAEVSLFRLPEGSQAVAGATIVVPLETSLPAQVTIAIDAAAGKRYPFAFCNPVGCYARVGLTEKDVAAYKRGNEAKITIVPALAPDQKVVLTLSLEGFTAAYDKTSVIDR